MSFKIQLVFVAICLIALLNANVTRAEELKPLRANEGYLLVGIQISGLGYSSVSIDKPGTLGFAYTIPRNQLSDGVNFKLIPLREGLYFWRAIELANAGRFNFGKTEFPMQVVAGQINYGGLFVGEGKGFRRAYFHRVNRATTAIDYLERCCAQLLLQMPIRYAAGNEDPFLDYYRSISLRKGD